MVAGHIEMSFPMMKMEIFSVEVDFWHGFCTQKNELKSY